MDTDHFLVRKTLKVANSWDDSEVGEIGGEKRKLLLHSLSMKELPISNGSTHVSGARPVLTIIILPNPRFPSFVTYARLFIDSHEKKNAAWRTADNAALPSSPEKPQR